MFTFSAADKSLLGDVVFFFTGWILTQRKPINNSTFPLPICSFILWPDCRASVLSPSCCGLSSSLTLWKPAAATGLEGASGEERSETHRLSLWELLYMSPWWKKCKLKHISLKLYLRTQLSPNNLFSSQSSCCTPPQLRISVRVVWSSQSWTRTQARLQSSFRFCPCSRLSSTGSPSSSLSWSLTCRTGDRSLSSSAPVLEEISGFDKWSFMAILS